MLKKNVTIRRIMSLVFVFVLLSSVVSYAAVDVSGLVVNGEGWLQTGEGVSSGLVETEVFATASNGTVSLDSSVPPSFNQSVTYTFTADSNYEYSGDVDSLKAIPRLSNASGRNAGMNKLWSNASNDSNTTANIASHFNLITSAQIIDTTTLKITVSIARNDDVKLKANQEPELTINIDVVFAPIQVPGNDGSDNPSGDDEPGDDGSDNPSGDDEDETTGPNDEEEIIEEPVIENYAVRVESNIPVGAVFAGYGTGFSDGEAYSVNLASFDSANYIFLGWSASTSGNIAGSDVELVANFEAIPVPETYSVSAFSSPAGVATFSGTGSGFLDGDAYNVAVASIVDGYEFAGWITSSTGNIAGTDVVVEAVFTEIVVQEEDIPEEVPEVIETPETEDVFLDEETPEDVPLTLPETGGIPISMLSGLGFVLAGAGTVLRKRSK